MCVSCVCLFVCDVHELTGKKLCAVLRKTSQVLDKALSEHYLQPDSSVSAICSKVVWKCLYN